MTGVDLAAHEVRFVTRDAIAEHCDAETHATQAEIVAYAAITEAVHRGLLTTPEACARTVKAEVARQTRELRDKIETLRRDEDAS